MLLEIHKCDNFLKDDILLLNLILNSGKEWKMAKKSYPKNFIGKKRLRSWKRRKKILKFNCAQVSKYQETMRSSGSSNIRELVKPEIWKAIKFHLRGCSHCR